MIKPDSFVAFGEKTSYTQRTIYRAEIKSETLGNLKNQKYFVIFYPRRKKRNLITLTVVLLLNTEFQIYILKYWELDVQIAVILMIHHMA